MSVWRSATIPTWVRVLRALEQAHEPIRAVDCGHTGASVLLRSMERSGLVFHHGKKWAIEEKGREYLLDARRDMEDFLGGDG